MRGRRSLWVRTGALEARRPRRSRWQSSWNLDALTVEELEALMPLSEKQAVADMADIAPVWTPDEQALLHQLAAKAGIGQ